MVLLLRRRRRRRRRGGVKSRGRGRREGGQGGERRRRSDRSRFFFLFLRLRNGGGGGGDDRSDGLLLLQLLLLLLLRLDFLLRSRKRRLLLDSGSISNSIGSISSSGSRDGRRLLLRCWELRGAHHTKEEWSFFLLFSLFFFSFFSTLFFRWVSLFFFFLKKEAVCRCESREFWYFHELPFATKYANAQFMRACKQAGFKRAGKVSKREGPNVLSLIDSGRDGRESRWALLSSQHLNSFSPSPPLSLSLSLSLSFSVSLTAYFDRSDQLTRNFSGEGDGSK